MDLPEAVDLVSQIEDQASLHRQGNTNKDGSLRSTASAPLNAGWTPEDINVNLT